MEGKMTFRTAERRDISDIVYMLAHDQLGKLREAFKEPLPEQYHDAFDKITRDPNQELIVMEDVNHTVVGTLQLSFLQYLTYQGGLRAQIEAVRIRHDQRGKGFGEKLLAWAIARSRQRGAHVVQLTTDKKRPDAVRFYEKLGFIASHEGMKLHVGQK